MNSIDNQKLFSEIVAFPKKRDVTKIAVFGSYVRDEETPKSDIDVIVEFKETPSLLDFVALERQLSEHIGVKVDLLTEKSISPLLINRIKNEMRILYQ
jgi:predicted nucleotidyltransferase